MNKKIRVFRPAFVALIIGFGLGISTAVKPQWADYGFSYIAVSFLVGIVYSVVAFFIVFIWQGMRRYLTKPKDAQDRKKSRVGLFTAIVSDEDALAAIKVAGILIVVISCYNLAIYIFSTRLFVGVGNIWFGILDAVFFIGTTSIILCLKSRVAAVGLLLFSTIFAYAIAYSRFCGVNAGANLFSALLIVWGSLRLVIATFRLKSNENVLHGAAIGLSSGVEGAKKTSSEIKSSILWFVKPAGVFCIIIFIMGGLFKLYEYNRVKNLKNITAQEQKEPIGFEKKKNEKDTRDVSPWGISHLEKYIEKPVTKNTRFGALEVKNINEFEKGLFCDSKLIYKSETGYVYILKVFQIGNSDVAFVSENGGGTGTWDFYFFVTLSQNGNPVVSESFSAQWQDGLELVQNKSQLTADLGYDDGFHKMMTYQNGKVTIEKTDERNKKSPADENDCNYLYMDIYSIYVDKNECKEDPWWVGGAMTDRAVGTLSNDPRLNMKAFKVITKDSCKKRSKINYTEFQKKVCGM